MAKVKHESSFSWNNYAVAFLDDVRSHSGTMNVSKNFLPGTFSPGGCNAIRSDLGFHMVWSGSPPLLWSDASKLGKLTRFHLAMAMAGANEWMSWLLCCCYANSSQLGVIWFTALRLCLWSYLSPLITTQRLNSHTNRDRQWQWQWQNMELSKRWIVIIAGALKLHPQAKYWHSIACGMAPQTIGSDSADCLRCFATWRNWIVTHIWWELACKVWRLACVRYICTASM